MTCLKMNVWRCDLTHYESRLLELKAIDFLEPLLEDRLLEHDIAIKILAEELLSVRIFIAPVQQDRFYRLLTSAAIEVNSGLNMLRLIRAQQVECRKFKFIRPSSEIGKRISKINLSSLGIINRLALDSDYLLGSRECCILADESKPDIWVPYSSLINREKTLDSINAVIAVWAGSTRRFVYAINGEIFGSGTYKAVYRFKSIFIISPHAEDFSKRLEIFDKQDLAYYFYRRKYDPLHPGFICKYDKSILGSIRGASEFMNEALACHPRLLSSVVIPRGLTPNQGFGFMERCDCTLFKYLGHLTFLQTLAFTEKILFFLNVLHAKKVIFADIKSINFMVKGDELRIIDIDSITDMWSEWDCSSRYPFYGSLTNSAGVFSPFTDIFGLSLMIIEMILKKSVFHIPYTKEPDFKSRFKNDFEMLVDAEYTQISEYEKRCLYSLLDICGEVINIDRRLASDILIHDKTTTQHCDNNFDRRLFNVQVLLNIEDITMESFTDSIIEVIEGYRASIML